MDDTITTKLQAQIFINRELERLNVIDLDGNPVRVPMDDDRALRRFCCGSTDVSKIMGTSSYDGPYDLYHSKLNDEVVDVSPQMKMGLLIEPVFRQLTQESLEYLGLDPSDEPRGGRHPDKPHGCIDWDGNDLLPAGHLYHGQSGQRVGPGNGRDPAPGHPDQRLLPRQVRGDAGPV